MKRPAACIACTISALLVLVTVALGQGPAIGTPPFGSFSGGPFDVINLGNLNVHFTIPVLHKAGRGMPFAYDLNYDTSFWYPGYANGIQTWQPVNTSYWGWQGLSGGAYTNLTYTTTYSSGTCGQFGTGTWQAWQFGNLVYTDQNGAHTFGYGSSFIQTNGVPNCPPAGPSPSTAQLAKTEDSSGLTAYVPPPSGSSLGTVSINNPHGITFPQGGYGGTDPNGNEITGNNGVYTDTLGVTTLTVAGVPPNATTYTYAAPSNPNAAYTMSYKSYTVTTNFGCSGVAEYTATGVYLVDKITLPDGTLYQFEYEATAGGSGQVTGRLASVSLPTGGSISYTYAMNGTHNGINCGDGSAPIANPSLTRTLSPGGTWKYARTDLSGAHWQTTITDPTTAGNQTVVDLQKDANTATVDFYETQRQVYAGSATGTPLSTAITCFNGIGVSSPSICPASAVAGPISRQTVFSYLPNPSSSSAESEIDTQYYGSIAGFSSEVDTYDYGKGAVGPMLNKVITAYSTVGNQVLPSSVTVEDSGSNTKAYTSYSYDQWTPTATSGTPNHISVTAARGNLTTIATQANSGTTLYRKLTYYDTGMLNTASDLGTASGGGPNLTTYNYSDATSTCGNAFPSSISEPMSLSGSFTWNCVGGVNLTTTDENSKVVTSDYSADPDFWRPDYTLDRLLNKTTFAYPTNPTATESNLSFNSNNSVSDLRTTVDGFGRVVLSQQAETPGLGEYDISETDYNVSGQPSKSTIPFQAPKDTTSSSAPGTTTVYDALGRPYLVTDGGTGTVSYTYTGNDVLQAVGPAPTGENTKQKQLEYDGLGRLTSVCEITSASGSGACGQFNPAIGFLTTYTYNAPGNLLTVTQNAQPGAIGGMQTRKYFYDSLSRLTSEFNPEWKNNSTTYSYDTDATCGTSNGDLVKRVDAANNVTCFTYDALHRNTGITYPSGPNAAATPAKTFIYDGATVNGHAMQFAKGRLAEAYTGSKTTDLGFSYDADGRIIDFYESTPHSSGYYDVTASYWANGMLDTLKGVGLPTLTYGPDGEGRPKIVSASGGVNPVSSTSYNSAGQATDVTFGSLDPAHFEFDSGTGRMTKYMLTINGTAVYGNPQWNLNGTLKQLVITDPFNVSDAQTCKYGYDDLARVASVDCGATIWQQNFTYDPFGNITKSVPLSGTGIAFNPGYDPATNRYTDGAIYDLNGNGNGNLTNDGTDHQYSWDTDGRPVTLDSLHLIYDALGREAELQNGSANTEFAYGPTGKLALMNGQTQTKAFVPLPGGTQVKYAGGSISTYRLPDWLGSFRVGSNPNRTYSWGLAFAPFGEQYAIKGSAALSFTGEEGTADTVSDEYDFLARKLHSKQGRWISPDPAGLGAVDTTNPQTWNRYAYVMNNPLANIDPLGLCSLLTTTTTFTTNSQGTAVSVTSSTTPLWPGPCAAPPSGCMWISAAGSGEGSQWTGMQCGNSQTGGPLSVTCASSGCITEDGGGTTANNGTPQTPQQTPKQQCQAAAQAQLDSTTSDITNRTPWKAIGGGAGFGFITGSAILCISNPALTALCYTSYGAAALPAGLMGAFRGGSGAYAMWVLNNIGALNTAQSRYQQQVQNVCSKLPG
jgi:RHS repeat-associated protein